MDATVTAASAVRRAATGSSSSSQSRSSTAGKATSTPKLVSSVKATNSKAPLSATTPPKVVPSLSPLSLAPHTVTVVSAAPTTIIATIVASTTSAASTTSLSPHALAWEYIIAHESFIPNPKYTYAYIFWIILAGLSILYALAHHARLSGGWLGAAYNKWGIRRRSIRAWPRRWGKAFIMPSNSYLLIIGTFGLALILLATVGPDHLEDSKAAFDFSPAKATAAPYAAATAAAHAKRTVDNSVEELTTHVLWEVKKSVWTQGNRWGFMAFAALPLIVALALKSSPFGIFTIKWFTHVHWDKVSTLHRAGGWFVWFMVTVHVVVWTVKLWQDHYDGRPMWFAMLTVYRFRCGITAYVAMTLAMVFSLRPIRNRSYEVFYWSHCVLIFIAMVGALIHHFTIWYWVAIALGLWGGDRLYRFVRYRYINGSKRLSEADVKELSARHPADQPPFISARSSSYTNASVVDPTLFPRPAHIPPGMAQVQLLPSRTMRISIRTDRPMKWHPGQSVFLHLPDLSHFQTHPFTISNNDPAEVVLIVKARKGLTRKLYDHVLEQSNKHSSEKKRESVLPRAEPVLIRAGIDGPMGSAGRVSWLSYSTVLIVCGGSGVTFGLTMCDYISRTMAQTDFNGVTQRVRFVWIVREYAEITWAAGAMCRFKATLPDPSRLQIDIYVTKEASALPFRRGRDGEPRDEKLSVDELAPPQPAFALSQASSSDSLWTAGSSSDPQRGYYEGVDPETQTTFDEVIGLTNYDDETDADDPVEDEFSRHLQHEGRVRRAASRKAAKKRLVSRKQDLTRTPVAQYPPAQSDDSRPASLALPDSDNFEQLQTDQDGSMPHKYRSVDLNRDRVARRSASMDSGYERYEPYGCTSTGLSPLPSPTASMVFDDPEVRNTIMSLSSRTQSMVLLEDTHDGKEHKCDSCGRAGNDMLWIDEADYAAAMILSENARTGRPRLASIVDEELRCAAGAMIVASCGPGALTNAMRKLVSQSIDPGKIRRGDLRGNVALYTEDFEM